MTASVALLAPVAVTNPATAATEIQSFEDATGTVACQIVPPSGETYETSVRCDLLSGVPARTPLPPPPADCYADWSPTARLGEYGLAEWGACIGDSIENGNRLAPGSVVSSGAITCTVIDPGVSCRTSTPGYGFRLAPDAMTPTRPRAKALLSPDGLRRLKLGMTEKQARRTGYLGAAVCDSPQLKGKLHWRAWLSWRHGRFTGLLANMYSNLQATKGVGVGSTLAQVRDRYRGRVIATKDLVEDARAYVYRVRGKRGQMVFILDSPATRPPAPSDPVGAIWLTRRWKPSTGFAFDGC